MAQKQNRAHLPWPQTQGYNIPGEHPIAANNINITLPRSALYTGSNLPQPAIDPVLDVFDLQVIVNYLRNVE